MFWSGNYMVERELTTLLKDPNVSLKQVLEAEDVLQECKVDNKGLIQFVTKPEILAELVTLITEEPPPHIELSTQYRHASMACEVLTSQLSMLADRLSSDTVQMNRLCDFLNQDPPLNPLLASFFSKTVEMLLQRNPKQDWYLYHIVCLRVLDFFRSRSDFLPNLLRHMSTSAIADIFKYFICLDDLFSKAVIEWLEEHQFLESVIQIVCGSYETEVISPKVIHSSEETNKHSENGPVDLEKVETSITSEGSLVDECSVVGDTVHGGDDSGVSEVNHKENNEINCLHSCKDPNRLKAIAATSASELLADIILHTANTDNAECRGSTVTWVVSRLQSGVGAGSLLRGMFTAPAPLTHTALAAGTHVLLALLTQDPIISDQSDNHRTAVELSIAPHLPLLHQVLLEPHERAGVPILGRGRLSVCRLISSLCGSASPDVALTLVTLATPGEMCRLFFSFPDHSLLHQEVNAMINRITTNDYFGDQYMEHLLVEYDLLTKLMDAYEQNELNKKEGKVVPGNSGHVVQICRRLSSSSGVLPVLPNVLHSRWTSFIRETLAPLADRLDTPLGGYFSLEQENDAFDMVIMPDTAEFELNDNIDNTCDAVRRLPDHMNPDDWDIEDSPWSPTEECGEREGSVGEQWADFSDVFSTPLDPFASSDNSLRNNNPVADMEKQLSLVTSELTNLGFEFSQPPPSCTSAAREREEMTVDETQLTNNLLTAISGMDPQDVANLVNSNCKPGDAGVNVTEETSTSNAEDTHTQQQPLNMNTSNEEESALTSNKEQITNENYNLTVDNVVNIVKSNAGDEAGNATDIVANVREIVDNAAVKVDNITEKNDNVAEKVDNAAVHVNNAVDKVDNIIKIVDNATVKVDNVTDKNVNAIAQDATQVNRDATASDSEKVKTVECLKDESKEINITSGENEQR